MLSIMLILCSNMNNIHVNVLLLHACTHTHACTRVLMYTPMHTPAHAHTHAQTHAHTRLCIRPPMHAHTHTHRHMHACMHAHTHIHTRACTHTHNTHTQLEHMYIDFTIIAISKSNYNYMCSCTTWLVYTLG